MHLETPSTATLSLIPEGKAGIVATLRVMSRLVKDGKKNLTVRDTTVSQLRNCRPKDYSCEVRAIHAYVRDVIRYVQDISNVETIQTADKTIENYSGDCDDKSVLLAAMLESVNHPTRFIAIGFHESGVFEHVYVETKIGASWVPLETTEDVEAGWNPADAAPVRAYMQFYN